MLTDELALKAMGIDYRAAHIPHPGCPERDGHAMTEEGGRRNAIFVGKLQQ